MATKILRTIPSLLKSKLILRIIVSNLARVILPITNIFSINRNKANVHEKHNKSPLRKLYNTLFNSDHLIGWLWSHDIKCWYFDQSALREGCLNRNQYYYIHFIMSFITLYETSWNFVIMFGYENYSSDKNMQSKYSNTKYDY